MSVNRARRVLCCYKLLLPLLYNGDPHTKAVRKPALLKPFFRENMFLVKDAGLTIKLISPGIFYNSTKASEAFIILSAISILSLSSN